MVIKDEILKHQNDFINTCKLHNVIYLFAFGSSTSEDFDNQNSDILIKGLKIPLQTIKNFCFS